MNTIFLIMNLVLGIIACLFAAHIAALMKGGALAKPMNSLALAIIFFTVGATSPLVNIPTAYDLLNLIHSASLMIGLLLCFLATYNFREALINRNKKS